MVDTAVLQKFSLFRELNESQLQKFAAHIQQKQYPAGSTICSQGEEGDEIFLVNRGMVSVVLPLHRYDSKFRTVSKLGEGNFFGELSFFDGQKRSAEVQAKEEVELLVFSRQDYNRIIKEDLQEGCRIQGKIIAGLVGIIRKMNDSYSSSNFLLR